MELEPVGMPGHFLVGCYSEVEPFYIDAFEQGAFRSASELVLALRAQGIEPSLGDLAPSPVREVLARCCRNLVNHYAAAGDEAKARMFESFVTEFEAARSGDTPVAVVGRGRGGFGDRSFAAPWGCAGEGFLPR
jgi:regulator of sirC expression with transglutaminase-like and TPR domain